MKVKSKVWLEKDGNLFFGTGRLAIFKAVEAGGSINKAAKRLNMSYRRIWSYIQSAEKAIKQPLLIKIKGGRGGGGAHLTAYTKNLLNKFERFEQDVKEFSDRRFKEIFKW